MTAPFCVKRTLTFPLKHLSSDKCLTLRLAIVLVRPDFLLLDLRDFFSDLGSRDEKKALSFSELFFIFRAFFLISPEQTVNLVK